MKPPRLLLLGLVLAGAAQAGEPRVADTDLAVRRPDHSAPPPGRLEGPFEFHSQVFAGTVRRYWIFVPGQYDPATPASLLVFQDGQRATNPDGPLKLPAVLAQLAAEGAIPPTIGVFVTPGNRSRHYPDDLGMRNPDHRAEEYDALDDDYARMLVDELLPVVAERYNISTDPEQRAIGGTSSGAICAFTVAWHRPDHFRKVVSLIGSYVSIGFREPSADNGMQWVPGGQDYPALIRRSAIRPLRIFLQDGANDLDNEWGHWYLANQQMVKAFAYANRIADERGEGGARYAVWPVWTQGGHSDEDGGARLPEALRWLWSGAPVP